MQENDEGDQYMAESIAEAEKEISKSKNGQNVEKEAVIKAEEEAKDNEQEGGSESAKKIKQMTQELIEGALSTQSKVSYTGGDVEVSQFGVDGIAEEKQLQKEAIKMALNDIKGVPAKNATESAKAAFADPKKNETKAALAEPKKADNSSKAAFAEPKKADNATKAAFAEPVKKNETKAAFAEPVK